MSEQAITPIVVAFFGLLTTVAGFVSAYYMAKLKQQAVADALEVAKVKNALEASTKTADVKLDKLAVVVDATHKLANSNMGIQLELAASALRRVANLTQDKEDEAVAFQAEEKYRLHQAKQSIVDADHPAGIPDAGGASK